MVSEGKVVGLRKGAEVYLEGIDMRGSMVKVRPREALQPFGFRMNSWTDHRTKGRKEEEPNPEVSLHARSCNRIPITSRFTLRTHNEWPGKIHRLG